MLNYESLCLSIFTFGKLQTFTIYLQSLIDYYIDKIDQFKCKLYFLSYINDLYR